MPRSNSLGTFAKRWLNLVVGKVINLSCVHALSRSEHSSMIKGWASIARSHGDGLDSLDLMFRYTGMG